ncbi:S-adenosyl-L-methionine-dependent methyltransferase [Podospora australis]|uniref:S-adenosyl-L-methionine-dependent methyltransferase n=1 Tax=Podospora australis TaxID=1536484 RepID=A0AAN7AEB2_9PEZI|nr:S-adenosyl-L-methionine-dependent methyltransferase [Podospora australis]
MADSTAAASSPPPPAPAGAAATAPDPQQQPEIDVDPDFQDDDADSALGDDNASSTASVSSSIFEYRKIHGRTFHNFGQAKEEYWAPNDETQNEQLDINHHLLTLALNDRLYLAPLENPKKVLDIGTGTGIWAIDFADGFPNAEVIGTDLSPIQPVWVPPNCKFQLDDASQVPWTFHDNSLDYVHIRYMIGCFKDWQSVYREAYRVLKPGGWLEHMECSSSVLSDDGSLPEDSIFSDWKKLFKEAGAKMGQTFEIIDDDKWVGWLKEAGFAHVNQKTIKAPVGEWPKDKRMKQVGQFNQYSLTMGIEGFGLFVLTTVLGWEYNKVQVFMAKMKEALRNRDYHSYVIWGVAWTQKPFDA